ncbi:MAG TPA: hypothetical protein VEC35_13520 [Noviherbaspirillum sp.]|nr:hypothetical protein [Noviherbaspirillum sp.]
MCHLMTATLVDSLAVKTGDSFLDEVRSIVLAFPSAILLYLLSRAYAGWSIVTSAQQAEVYCNRDNGKPARFWRN